MAQGIKVNANAWNGLAPDDQQRVKNILSATGLSKGLDITPDQGTPQGALVGGEPEFLGINFCKIGCDLAEGAAVAACATLPPPANVACVAAAHAAADLCRSKC